MARVLIAYATNEGQTAKIADALAGRIATTGADVRVVDLGKGEPGDGLDSTDAVIVAASVHAGKHQDSATRFVRDHRGTLDDKHTAFLSVSMSAAAGQESGRERAGEQVQIFLDETGWAPDLSETVAGAFHFSAFSRPWQWIVRVSQRVFRKPLRQLGWPDLTADQEFTDWAALRRFADRFCGGLEGPGDPAPDSAPGAVKGPGRRA